MASGEDSPVAWGEYKDLSAHCPGASAHLAKNSAPVLHCTIQMATKGYLFNELSLLICC